ncbi:MAG UNVERIFIED_CONTAM: DUF4347 domain-containing protein [Microcystis novacekii LVE1205-3]|jgi:hypothetical protein
MTSTLLPSFPAVDDVLFNFAQSDGLSQANQVNSARNQRLTATRYVFLDAGVTDYQSLQAGVIPEVATVILSANQDGIEQITAFTTVETLDLSELQTSGVFQPDIPFFAGLVHAKRILMTQI